MFGQMQLEQADMESSAGTCLLLRAQPTASSTAEQLHMWHKGSTASAVVRISAL